jgi:hypothetical protein
VVVCLLSVPATLLAARRDQGTGTVAALAKELERGSLYLWWD